jgi:hypothetical protein
MSYKPLALILGAGPNAGTAISSSLSALGYRIALVSRTTPTSTSTSGDNDTLLLQADFSTPSSIPPLFSRLYSQTGRYPSVVVYNAATLTPPSKDSGGVTGVPQEAFARDLMVNSVSPYVAAQEAVKGWLSEEASDSEPVGDSKEGGKVGKGNKTFIYTGNMLNQTILPVEALVTLGVGKSASAYWIGLADEMEKARGKGWRYVSSSCFSLPSFSSLLYPFCSSCSLLGGKKKRKGNSSANQMCSFFYADQRQPDGSPMGNVVDGPAHGAFYADLVQRTHEVPWLATFVKDKGHVKF